MSSRVAVYEACGCDRQVTFESLQDQGFDLVQCTDARSVLEQVVQRHVDALVYAVCDDKDQDLGLLRLIRRAAPELPLVFVTRDDSLAERRELQSFNPIFYAVAPPDAAELGEAVRAAASKSARHARTTYPGILRVAPQS